MAAHTGTTSRGHFDKSIRMRCSSPPTRDSNSGDGPTDIPACAARASRTRTLSGTVYSDRGRRQLVYPPQEWVK